MQLQRETLPVLDQISQRILPEHTSLPQGTPREHKPADFPKQIILPKLQSLSSPRYFVRFATSKFMSQTAQSRRSAVPWQNSCLNLYFYGILCHQENPPLVSFMPSHHFFFFPFPIYVHVQHEFLKFNPTFTAWRSAGHHSQLILIY